MYHGGLVLYVSWKWEWGGSGSPSLTLPKSCWIVAFCFSIIWSSVGLICSCDGSVVFLAELVGETFLFSMESCAYVLDLDYLEGT
jgi:hypothetical protein